MSLDYAFKIRDICVNLAPGINLNVLIANFYTIAKIFYKISRVMYVTTETNVTVDVVVDTEQHKLSQNAVSLSVINIYIIVLFTQRLFYGVTTASAGICIPLNSMKI